jgi:hypothetical protein
VPCVQKAAKLQAQCPDYIVIDEVLDVHNLDDGKPADDPDVEKRPSAGKLRGRRRSIQIS